MRAGKGIEGSVLKIESNSRDVIKCKGRKGGGMFGTSGNISSAS